MTLCIVEKIKDDLWKCSVCGFEYKKQFKKECKEAPQNNIVKDIKIDTNIERHEQLVCNTGCQLHKILSKWGFEETESCACNSFSLKMDTWGPDGCEAHMQEIIDWMVKQFEARKNKQEGLGVVATGIINITPTWAVPVLAKRLIKQAIRLARKEEKKRHEGI